MLQGRLFENTLHCSCWTSVVYLSSMKTKQLWLSFPSSRIACCSTSLFSLFIPIRRRRRCCIQASVWKSARLKSSNNMGESDWSALTKTLCLMGRQAGQREGSTGRSIEPRGLWLLRCDFYTSPGAGWEDHQEQVLWKNLRPSQLQPRKLLAGLAGNEVCIDRPTVDSYFCLPTVKLFQSLRLRFFVQIH